MILNLNFKRDIYYLLIKKSAMEIEESVDFISQSYGSGCASQLLTQQTSRILSDHGFTQEKQDILKQKMHLSQRYQIRLNHSYLLMRRTLIKIMEGINKLMNISIGCFDRAVMILDKLSQFTQIPASERICLILCTACLVISQKIGGGLYRLTSNLCRVIGVCPEEIFSMEQFIIQKFDYDMIFPTITDYYTLMYEAQPSALLYILLKSQLFANQHRFVLAHSLRILESKSQSSPVMKLLPANEEQELYRKAQEIIKEMSL